MIVVGRYPRADRLHASGVRFGSRPKRRGRPTFLLEGGANASNWPSEYWRPVCLAGIGMQVSVGGRDIDHALAFGLAITGRMVARIWRYAAMKLSVFHELSRFLMSKRSRMVMIPFVIVLVLLAGLFIIAESAAWAPFVYAIF
ncbi:DUF5989 family protein [Consotaella aegiceratis]|uniref:DUF5989 family protein n=1 Tax=Consotaella aegiceratis TaxID=3097961 RepID=UPI002F3F3998